MFANVGWGEMLILVVLGLVILGPERLPGAIRWSAGALRQARDYLDNATGTLRDEMGSDFDDLRVPLSELQKLRGMTPRAAITKHLLDGDDSLFTAVGRLTDRPGATQSTGTLDPVPPVAEPAAAASDAPDDTTPFDREAT